MIIQSRVTYNIKRTVKRQYDVEHLEYSYVTEHKTDVTWHYDDLAQTD